MVAMKVLLWTIPRSVSTAFERAMMTLNTAKVFHEPYSMPYYFGPERQSLRYASTPIDPKETYLEVNTMLCKDHDSIEVVFSKNMAYYVENRFEILLDEELKDFKHSFLIRDPATAVPSLYRASTNPKLTGWNYFDGEEAGFRQMYELYQFVTEHLDPNPVVIDADDLLDHPNETMKSYCDAVGITYEPHMTTWEPGPVPDWGFWTGWYESVLKSSGIKQRTTKKTKSKEQEVLPEEVVKVIEESTPHYKYLEARKLRVSSCCGRSNGQS